MSLYTVTRPMQVNDYHDGLIRGQTAKAKLMAMLKDGKPMTNWAGTWGVEPFKKRSDPTAAEGADKTGGWTHKVPIPITGQGQVFQSVGWLVTEEAEAMPAGYDKRTNVEGARQQVSDGKDFLLSIESIVLSDQDAVEIDTGVNRRTRGMFKWLDPSQGAFQAVPASLRPSATQFYTGAYASYDETAFMAQIQAAAIAQGQEVALMGLCGLALKTKLSNFNIKVPVSATIQDTRQVVAKDHHRFDLTVDIFEYEGGTVRTTWMPGLLPDRSDPTEFEDSTGTGNSGLFLDMDMWRMQWLIRIAHRFGTDNGGGKRGFHKASGRLQCLNPGGQFAVKPAS